MDFKRQEMRLEPRLIAVAREAYLEEMVRQTMLAHGKPPPVQSGQPPMKIGKPAKIVLSGAEQMLLDNCLLAAVKAFLRAWL